MVFTLTELCKNTTKVTNYVQGKGVARIIGRGRPEFVVVEAITYDGLLEKIAELEEEINSLKKA